MAAGRINGRLSLHWRRARVAREWIANPSTGVRFPPAPLIENLGVKIRIIIQRQLKL